MDFKRAAEIFNALPNDTDRWKQLYCSGYKDHVIIYLDNDHTFGVFDNDLSDEPVTLNFDEYVGNRGVINLLDVLEIKWEHV